MSAFVTISRFAKRVGVCFAQGRLENQQFGCLHPVWRAGEDESFYPIVRSPAKEGVLVYAVHGKKGEKSLTEFVLLYTIIHSWSDVPNVLLSAAWLIGCGKKILEGGSCDDGRKRHFFRKAGVTE